MRLHFADCVFDPDTREVVRAGQLVPLPPKAFQLLDILIRERPNAVSKERLHEELWPATFVSDANLANLVGDLRAGLGDHAKKPRIIRTVQRFGYAFSAEARPLPSAARAGRAGPKAFRLIWGDREIALVEGENFLGRDEDCAAWIDVHSVSRHHARIVVAGGTATLEDLGSKNGTFVRDERIEHPTALKDGDEIRIGTVPMTLRLYRPGVSTQTARS
jgi:DNA-binding winged helix-turn-helix (wHTH) protein